MLVLTYNKYVNQFCNKDVEMYYYKKIDESEYKLDYQFNRTWKYIRKNPINVTQKNNRNEFLYKNNIMLNAAYFGEVIGSQIAKVTIGNACDAELAKQRRGFGDIYDNGVISYYYFAKDDKQISPFFIIQDYYKNEGTTRKGLPNLDDIFGALKYLMLRKYKRPYSEYEKLKQQFTNNYQQADTGTKMIHIGKNTRSLIVSKGISAGRSQNSYRGLVRIGKNATHSRNFSQCDSLLMGDKCGAHTWPYADCHNNSSILEHEASTGKISEDQLFYCQQRGISMEKAVSLIVNGYAKGVLEKLPLEFAAEAQELLSITLKNSIG